MIRFPTTIAEAALAPGSVRAGATDLHERRHRGLAEGPIVDLRDLEGLAAIEVADGVRIGARVTIDRVASDPSLAPWHALQEAAGGLATPQIRNRATVGGNLLQEVRCWYFRHPDLRCVKRGGPTCLARAGDALFHVWDGQNGTCIAPHPSTLAVALLAWDGAALLDGDEPLDVQTLLGDGVDPRRTHALPPGRLVVGVILPAPALGEGSAYVRAAHRARAEWPLVEVVARVTRAGGKIAGAQIAVGAVRNRPYRLSAVERALAGASPDDLGAAVSDGFPPLAPEPIPDTAYKRSIAVAAVEDAVRRAWSRSSPGESR